MNVLRRHLIQTVGAMTTASAGASLGATTEPEMSTQGSGNDPADIHQGYDTRYSAHRHVLIAGAGISGLVCAYELRKAGFRVTVLEAHDRVGGRVLTLRKGDNVDYLDGTRQTVDFDEGHYFNAGAARIPVHHHVILNYCRTFGLALEPYISASRHGLFRHPSEPQAIPQSRLTHAARGQFSEWLAKAAKSGALNDATTPAERDALLSVLRRYGHLDAHLRYPGKATDPSFDMAFDAWPDVPRYQPFPRTALLDDSLWHDIAYNEGSEDTPAMLQLSGGMDQLPRALQKSLDDSIRLSSPLQEIEVGETNTRFVFHNRRLRRDESLTGDFAVITLPCRMLAKIRHNMPDAMSKLSRQTAPCHATKLAWQSPRFWETSDHIYGGISLCGEPCEYIHYPSDGLGHRSGIIQTHTKLTHAREFSNLPCEAQYSLSKQAIETLHHQKGQLRHPVAVAWHRMPYFEGPWFASDNWEDEPKRLFRTGIHRTFFAGDLISPKGGFQNEAALSGLRAAQQIMQASSRLGIAPPRENPDA